ncbi:PKD domain-containing protein [Halomicrococcus sp. NG-SE-24]|uniref:PKD domain-containing protein n=1 Tax=Halomicrococcus sp. NG-SE-24 TaxID=3436928 RepID=UPI003D995399
MAQIKATHAGNRVSRDTEITFDASKSKDPDGKIAKYRWDLDSDGKIEKTGQQITMTPRVCGEFTVRLQVQSDDGATDTAKIVVSTS